MRSGMIAAEAIADNRRGVLREDDAWAQYEKNVRKEFSASFKYGGKIFRQMVRGRGLDVMVKTTSHPLIQSATAKLMAGF